ncbi:MAG: transposase [Planctomycetota bacterium]|jgi:REP element-mobilizing transposase RayT
MTKSIRDDAPGAVHHVTACVNWQFWLLRSPERAEYFLATLKRTTERFSLVLVAFVLLSNHCHLVTISPSEETYRALTWRRTKCRHFRPWPADHPNSTVLGQAMRHLRYSVARKVHTELDLRGQFWDGPYHARRVQDATDLLFTVAYDHRNPVRAGMTLRPEDHAWSSAAWWADNGSSPVPLVANNELPFGLTVEGFRPLLIQYQQSRHLDDVIQALRKKGTDWEMLGSAEREVLLREAGLPPIGVGGGARSTPV